VTDTPAAILADLQRAGLAISLLDGNLKLEGRKESISPCSVAIL
jgi:hypothetical protein